MAIPAICKLCGKWAIDEIAPNNGDWVEFSDYCPLSLDSNGDTLLESASGLYYYCAEHVAAARLLTSMPSAEALAALQEQFKDSPKYKRYCPPPPWWRRLFFNPGLDYYIKRGYYVDSRHDSDTERQK
jgi:hypothetical protein